MEINGYVNEKSKRGKIQYRHEHLTVSAQIKFDDETCFCGHPSVHLRTYYDDFHWGNPYEIRVSLHDMDDYDVGFVYKSDKEHFFDVLHELINWINDLEHGICIYDDYVKDIDGFFPDYLGCEREWW